ncbi:uncharacterized protein MONBRDRAFT_23368 [Monosiga brevicollis MX1]|uniref:Uncharacterized protein n=1 Tax=Monosiga brevicollis TaxID=81824 RepID=A9UT68_MONBE|nr:uncharacterized protein MONBRDRAFT_23368 [Monosiga brevicollis MX1]EDQ91440.1 predicted protein [Monosiga brevicollis MX1]|eukprot:XP_001743862.1 hypothetical protein [Monosiga brevicollis MX1]
MPPPMDVAPVDVPLEKPTPLYLRSSKQRYLQKDHRVQSETIVSFSYKCPGFPDRASNSVSGKNKRGAQQIKRGDPLGLIRLASGEEVTVASPCPGKLVDINTILVENPQLLKSHVCFA